MTGTLNVAPAGTRYFIEFSSPGSPGNALREASDWITENTGEHWDAVRGGKPVLTVETISSFQYEGWWWIRVYCEEVQK